MQTSRRPTDKCVYYDVPAIREWAQLCFEPRHIAFEALAMNWRGLLGTRSAAALRRLGLSTSFLSLVLAVALKRATWIVNHFRHSTYTIRSRWLHLICGWCSPESGPVFGGLSFPYHQKSEFFRPNGLNETWKQREQSTKEVVWWGCTQFMLV